MSPRYPRATMVAKKGRGAEPATADDPWQTAEVAARSSALALRRIAQGAVRERGLAKAARTAEALWRSIHERDGATLAKLHQPAGVYLDKDGPRLGDRLRDRPDWDALLTDGKRVMKAWSWDVKNRGLRTAADFVARVMRFSVMRFHPGYPSVPEEQREALFESLMDHRPVSAEDVVKRALRAFCPPALPTFSAWHRKRRQRRLQARQARA